MIVIGKNRFDLPAPGGMRSFALQQRILPVVGRIAGVFVQLTGGSPDPAALLDADVFKVLPLAMPYISEIFSSMPAGELETLTRELLKDATCDKTQLFGAPGGDPFDSMMQGRTMDTWKLLWHAVEVWYPDFFVLARSSTATDKKASLSGESSTSTLSGPAGA